MLLQLFCQFQSTDSRHSRIIIHLIRIHDLTALNKTTLQDNHLQPGTFPINPRRQPRRSGTYNNHIIHILTHTLRLLSV